MSKALGAAPSPTLKPDRLAPLKLMLETERAAIRDAFLDGSLDAPATCDRLMRAIDEVIRQALELVRRDLASAYPRKMAVLALGGYGRGAMFPFSDVDLQILSDKRERSQAEQMTERLLYILWDLGLKVGYATRSIDETLALVRDDVTVATAVLDARLLCGEEELFHQMERRLKAKYYDKQSSALIRALLEDKERRHERYGETIYLLEPNVKYGQGGLRDIQNAIWAAKVRYAIHAFPELVRLGIVRRRQLDDLLEARAFLWRVRHALQFLGGRKNDQLTFEYQERIARLFGFEDGESLGVERFMQSYYRHTKTIQTRSRLLVERCLTGSIGEKLRGSRRTIDENFRLYAGKLTVREADLFEHDPRQIVRIFRVSQREKRELYPHAKELIVRSLWRIDDAVRRDPETAQSFKELLCEVPDSEKSLMQMHELGVLSAYLPEFEAINGKTHHDVYHIYTVDVHTIYAVQRLKALASGELETRWPLATHLYRELTNVHPLYLALLLHDVGKGYGPGHSERGAKLVEPIAERLGLPPAEEETVRFLIRRHLLMAHTVEKHDLNDAGLVRRFAREVGDLTLLRQLYILTLCDMSTTGPQLSANWRDVMLQELYHKAADWLNEGLDLWNDPMKEVYRRKEEVINLTFPVHPGENYKAIGPIEEYFGLLPTRYFHATAASDIVRHMAMVKRLDSEPVVVDFDEGAAGPARVTVGCHDRPGVLSKISGVMAAYGLDILDAQINSLSTGLVLDVFRVQDPHQRTLDAPKRRSEFVADLSAVLLGTRSAEELLRSKRASTMQVRRFMPRVEPQIVVDNDTSHDFTLIEVHGEDAIGVLYRITHVLFELGLAIHVAKISSKGNKVLDVFYVQTESGAKIEAGPPTLAVRKALLAALECSFESASPAEMG